MPLIVSKKDAKKYGAKLDSAGNYSVGGNYSGGSSSTSSSSVPSAPSTPQKPQTSSYNVKTATPDQVKARILAYRATQGTPQDLTPEQVYKDAGYSDDPYSTALGAGIASAETEANQVIDENKIRRDILRQYQGEIDATNQIYRQQMTLAQQQGMGALGSDRAMSARSGLLGSDFATASQAGVENANKQVYNTIDATKLAAIGQIMSQARIEAQGEIEAKRAAKAAGSANYMAYLKDKQANDQGRQTNFVKSLLSRNVSLNELDPKRLKEIATSLGTNVEGLQALYSDEEAVIAEAKRKADLEQATFELDKTYKEGSLANQKEGNQIDWFNAQTARNKAITEAESGMTPGEVTAFNSIVGKYNASPLIMAADRTAVLKDTIKEVRNNPSDGPTQLNLVYSYIQALDTYQSAVREGELGLVNSIDSKIGSLEGYVQKIQNGQIVRPDVAKQIADAAENIVDTINTAASFKAKSYRSQADTVGLGEEWDKYIGGFTPAYDNGEDTPLEPGFKGTTSSGVSYTVN